MSPEPIEDTLETFDFGLQQGRWAEQRFGVESIGDNTLFPECSPELFESVKNPGDPGELAGPLTPTHSANKKPRIAGACYWRRRRQGCRW